MTAIRRRRTRAMTIGVVASLFGMFAVAGLGLLGVRTLADSTAGRAAADVVGPVTERRLPFTVTALLGVVDEDGRLTSLAVAVLDPDGVGGSIVQIPVSSDPSSGGGDDLEPLDAVLAATGPVDFREAVERLIGLSFDVIEIADEDRFAAWVAPLGDLTVDLPAAVADVSDGEIWEAGPQTMTGPEAARLMTALDAESPGWAYEPARIAVWEAVADRVGAGIGAATPVDDDRAVPLPASTDEFLGRLFSGPVVARGLQFQVLDPDTVAARILPMYSGVFGSEVADGVVVLDRAETLVVFGGIAPARMGSPLDAPNFRIVNGYAEADTVGLGSTPADLSVLVVNVFRYAKNNVVSVATVDGSSVPDVTQVRVSDPSLLEQFAAVYEPYLGTLEVSFEDAAIEGVDGEIVLGRSFLDRLARDRVEEPAG
jgi:hypothetical protein